MDPRAIYKATARLIHHAKWENTGQTEWIHSGLGAEFKESMVQERINQFFPQERVLLVLNRRNALDIPTDEAARYLRQMLSDGPIALWDHSLTQTMQFNRIGVFKCGRVSA